MMNTEEDELEWEEWDGKSPFVHHCVAGSIAGVAEHTLLYPVDTVKTHMQSYCADCPHGSSSNKTTAASLSRTGNTNGSMGMWRTMRSLVSNNNISSTTSSSRSAVSLTTHLSGNNPVGSSYYYHRLQGASRLWRGVQTMALGCVPAHALYFSSYEAVKAVLGSDNVVGSSVAGATAALAHDSIMTPIDTIKQRLQLGHYRGMAHAYASILATEGYRGLYRSFPITLATNIPYGILMVNTNDLLRQYLHSNHDQHGSSTKLTLWTTMLSGCGAGMVAAAATTPLDRVKTRLQTQTLALTNHHITTTTTTTTVFCDGMPVGSSCPKVATERARRRNAMRMPKYRGWNDALVSILKEEGTPGLFRGMLPRVLTHTPAVAISWTTYEMAKQSLLLLMSSS